MQCEEGNTKFPNLALSPSGKAQGFDPCIQWFESTKGCLISFIIDRPPLIMVCT